MKNTKKLIALMVMVLYFLSITAGFCADNKFYVDVEGDSTKYFKITNDLEVYDIINSSTGLFNIQTGNLKVGNGTPGHTQDGEDAYIEGILEVDDVVYLDGGLTLGADISTDYAIKSTTIPQNKIDFYNAGGDVEMDTSSSKDFILVLGAATDLFSVSRGNIKVGQGTPSLTQNGDDLYVTGSIEGDSVLNIAGLATLDSLSVTNDAAIAGDLGGESAVFTAGLSAASIKSTGTLGTDGLATLESLSVTNTSGFGGLVTVSGGGLKLNDNITLNLGTSSNASLIWSTTDSALLINSAGSDVQFGGPVTHNADLIVAAGSELDMVSTSILNFNSGAGSIGWNTTQNALLFNDDAGTAEFGGGVVFDGTMDAGGNITLENDEVISNSSNEVVTIANSTGTVLSIGTDVTCTNDIVATGGFKMPLFYSYANVDASWTDSVLNVQGEATAVLQEYVMPYDGSILAEAVAGNAALTTGTITFTVYKNGVSTGLSVTISDASPYGYTTQAKDSDTFSAGDRISVKLTSDSAVSPNTNDYQVTVYVEQ